MPADQKSAGAPKEADLREIESLVQAVPLEAPPVPATSPNEPDLEQVAKDLGISVEEVQALREAQLS